MWLVQLRIGILKKQITERRFEKAVSIIDSIVMCLKSHNSDIKDFWKGLLISEFTHAKDCLHYQPTNIQNAIHDAIYHLDCAKETLLKNAWSISRDRGQLLIAKRLGTVDLVETRSIGTLEKLPNDILQQLSLQLSN